MTREQATLYEAVVQDTMRQISDTDGIKRRGLILALLTRLKQVCNHPALLLHDGSPLQARSGKLARLGEMLEEVIASDERALVFTQYVAMARLLEAHLRQRGVESLFLHGGLPAPRRDEMVARSGGRQTVPQVFIDGRHIGGSDELADLEQSGKLDTLLAQPG